MKSGIFFLTLMILIGMSWQSWGQSAGGQGRGMGGPGPPGAY
jgi:hypothetical protein